MTREQLTGVLIGARAAIDSALGALEEIEDTCSHPEESLDEKTKNGDPCRTLYCTACGETIARPWE